MANKNERQKLISAILNKIEDENERDAEAFFLQQLSIQELKSLAESEMNESFNPEDL